MSDATKATGLSDDELDAEAGTALPDKEVVSILDLNADLDLALDVAAPIDLAVAANANVAAPIDAAVGANILSEGSTAQAIADQGVIIDQGITGDVSAESDQDSVISGADSTTDPAAAETGTTDPATDGGTVSADGLSGTTLPDGTTDGTTLPDGTTDGSLPDGSLPDGTVPDDLGSALDGNLLNVDVNLAADADVTAPINGAVAANANVAAPIDAAVAANIGSVDSTAVAVAQQDAIITQDIDGDATASADQNSEISAP